MALAHEEFRHHIGTGLSEANQLINLVGNGTFQSANTTIAQWKATNLVQQASFHEADKTLVTIMNRHVDTLNAIGVYGDTEVAASNTTATWEALFTAQDATFPAAYVGGRG